MSNPSSLRRLVPRVESRTRSESPTDDGSSASKRRCISSACIQCRKRKSKCDGDKPACENCSIVYKTECTYDIDSDHRRKGALKRDIRQLQEENEKRDIILDAIRKGSETDVDEIFQLVRSDEPYDSIIENIKRMPGKPMPPNLEAAPTLEGALAACPGKAPLTNTDEAQHYAHTSILALMRSDDDQHLPLLAVDQVGTFTKVTSDRELVRHLFDLYFTFSHPFYVFFSEEFFLHGFNNKQLKYCSPLLVNAVLALACNFSDRPEARADPNDPATVGDHFFAEAKRLFTDDDQSCLTTVQALGVMSLRQAMNNHESSSWKFSSQAITMAIELGLHLSNNAKSNEKTTAWDIEARRFTFWGSFVYSTLFASFIGRISLLPTMAVQCEMPIPRDNLEKESWKPLGDLRFPNQPTGLEQPAFVCNLLVQLGYLSGIINDVVHMFYAPRDRVTSRKLRQHHERFQDWYEGLPSVLAIKGNGPILPQVICLHIYYHNSVILLFRPYLKVSFVQGTKSPREICTEAAVTISKLMILHASTYEMRRACFYLIFSSMNANIILLVNISSQNSIAAEAAGYLANNLRMVQEMHPTYPRLTAYFKVIRGLVDRWLTVVPKNIHEALQAISLPSPQSSAFKPSDPSSNTYFPTDFSEFPTPSLDSDGKPNPSGMNFTQMTAHFNNGHGESTLAPQNFLWTPFPERVDGIPVMPLERRTSNYNMDISRMLDSGIDGDWAQLNRDGFTIDAQWESWGF